MHTIGQDVNVNLRDDILFSQSLVSKNMLVVDFTRMYHSRIAYVGISPESHIHMKALMNRIDYHFNSIVVHVIMIHRRAGVFVGNCIIGEDVVH